MHEYEYGTQQSDITAPSRPAGTRRCRTNLEGMVLAELQQVATGLGIKGAMRLRKSRLIEVIREAQGEQTTAVRHRPVVTRTTVPPPPTVTASSPNPRRRRGTGLEGMVLAELQQLASGLGIRGTARMRKSQLIEVIKEAQAGGGALAAKATAAPPEENTPQPAEAAEQQPEAQSRRAHFNAFGVRAISFGTQMLPVASRERWQEEWRAEWADLVEQRRRARLMFLVRLTFSSAPQLAWSLRRSSQREPA